MIDQKEAVIHRKLVENYSKYYRIAFGYVHNEADALDIVQEGAYKAIYFSDKLRQTEYADTWLCRIMMNESLEFLRKNKRESMPLEDYNEGMEAVYEDVNLRQALEALPQKDKTVVTLRYFEDMSLNEISMVLDENVSTVKSRLYRALGKLKLTLQE